MRSTRRGLAVLALAAATLWGVVVPGAAHATTPPAPAVGSADPGTNGLVLAGFDPAVARANGYEVVMLPDGAMASVPANKAEAARTGAYRPATGVFQPSEEKSGEAAVPGWEYGEAWGDCGWSYVSFRAVGSSFAEIQTGFVITDPGAGNVWDVNWNAGIHDNGGNTTQHWEEDQGST